STACTPPRTPCIRCTPWCRCRTPLLAGAPAPRHGGTVRRGDPEEPTARRPPPEAPPAASGPPPALYSPRPSLPSGWAEAGVSGTGSRVGQGAALFVGVGVGPRSRPAVIWHANAFASCMLTLGSATSEVRSLALPPTTSPANAQWKGRPT